jgi:hypothetical protein
MIYYYIVPEIDLSYDMVKYSYESLHNKTSTLDDLIVHEQQLRKVIDTTDSNKLYYVLKFRYNFCTALCGYTYYSESELITELQNVKWATP